MGMRINGALMKTITNSTMCTQEGTSLSKLNIIFKDHAEFKAHVVNSLTSREWNKKTLN
jgi:hypothetical protein